MLVMTHGDVLGSTARGWVNPINCRATSQSGMSARFAERFPHVAAYLRERAKSGSLQLGVVRSFMLPTDSPKCLFNFPVRSHWRSKAKLDDIERGLHGLRREVMWVNAMGGGIDSLAVPALGCGKDNGGLHWDDVHRLIDRCVSPWLQPDGGLHGIRIEIYEPSS